MIEPIPSCQGYYNAGIHSVPLVYTGTRAKPIYASSLFLMMLRTGDYFLQGSIALVEQELQR